MQLSRRIDDWPGPDYRVRQTFRAPIEYVFAWCTDYTADDPGLEGEAYQRRVVERSARRVVIEDLEDDGREWELSRMEVTLNPPTHWRAIGTGNLTDFNAEYRLSAYRESGCQLDLRWRRRYVRPPARRLTKAERERNGRAHWAQFARALGRDFRAGRPAARGRARRR